jgi:SAM-dependent methyltransferase
MSPEATYHQEIQQQYQKRGVNPDRWKAVQKHAGRSVLDVGCGSGAYVLKLHEDRKAAGVDYQPFESWREAPECFQVSPADQLPFPDGSFETVLCFETLEHLPDPQKALRECFRVATRNLILTVPNCQITPAMKESNLLYSHWSDRTHIQFYDLNTIQDAVRAAGFQIAEARLINRINLMPFFLEWMGISRPRLRSVAKRLGKRLGFRPHYITSLVVAHKPTVQ